MASATLVQDSSAGNTCPVLSIVDGRPVASSLKIAEHFEKAHQHVMRDIRALMSDAPECASNFGRTSVLLPMPNGGYRKSPAFDLDRDGFTLLAMGFTGPKALAWKILYMRKFNEMEQERHSVQALPIGPLTPAQCRHLHDVLDAKVGTLPKEHHRAAYAEAWTRFNRHFRIAKYAQLPQELFSDALAYLIGMKIVAGTLGPAVQKALPAASSQHPNIHVLPESELREDLIREIQRHGGNMHESVTRLWELIWRDVDRWRYSQGYSETPHAFSQLKHMADAAYNSLSSNIESVRRLARAVDVTYREMRRLHEERRQ